MSPHGSERDALSERALRIERQIAWGRTAFVAASAAVYGASIATRRDPDPVAMSVLSLASLYSVWILATRPYRSLDPRRFVIVTSALDTAFIALWCLRTGADESEFWVLFVVSAISIALRFEPVEGAMWALGQSLVYALVIGVFGEIDLNTLLLRPSLIFVAGVIVAVLAQSERIAEAGREQAEHQAKETSEQLDHERRVVERLRELDRAKSDFVATAAHELRSPLAGIRGVLETVRAVGEEIDPSSREELLEGASAQAARLSRLVDDLLTVSRIEDGEMRLNHAEVEVDRLVVEAARATGTEGRLVLESEGSTWVRCDADQIVRVLINLIDNARKYSPEGDPIEVALRRSGATLAIAVRDHGPGVRAEDRDAIFDRYLRVDGGETSGAGLGLWIVRNLVEAHGGAIAVDDAPGGGALFTVTVPNHPRVLGDDVAAAPDDPGGTGREPEADPANVREFTARPAGGG